MTLEVSHSFAEQRNYQPLEEGRERERERKGRREGGKEGGRERERFVMMVVVERSIKNLIPSAQCGVHVPALSVNTCYASLYH